MTGKPEEHQVPKPVADMFRVLQQGMVDERREANLLDEVKSRLLAEGHPTAEGTQPATVWISRRHHAASSSFPRGAPSAGQAGTRRTGA